MLFRSQTLKVLIGLLAFAGAAFAQKEAPKVEDRSTIDATFWGALVYATSEPAGIPIKDDTAKRLGKAFKEYKNFELLGQHTQGVVFRDYVNWIVPSEDINLGFESKGLAEGGGMKLLLKLWQQQKVLVKTDLVLKPGKPLFIAGPEWRKGRLIFVLELKDKPAEKKG